MISPAPTSRPIARSPTRKCGSSERCATERAASCHQRLNRTRGRVSSQQLAGPLDEQRRRLPDEDVERLHAIELRLLVDPSPLVPSVGPGGLQREHRRNQLAPARRASGPAAVIQARAAFPQLLQQVFEVEGSAELLGDLIELTGGITMEEA